MKLEERHSSDLPATLRKLHSYATAVPLSVILVPTFNTGQRDDNGKRMNPRQASAYLREVWGIIRSDGTLKRLRVDGGGPDYLKMASGEVIYTDEKLDAWVEANLTEHSSTASYPPDSGWRRPRRAYNPDGTDNPGDRQTTESSMN